ncbi:unnamed protein product [Clonostachys rosea f. rosea IK726]|uniref:Uncharacterized protein n=1 Tax=Clonostachys rosea f. rosea IK726 TaxID=1349383 RepID=A0ACA9URA0_BIOOC|nr:unnamed protein product [Clonostachys rosea f. rosea IK726]
MLESTSQPHGTILAQEFAYLCPDVYSPYRKQINAGSEFEILALPDTSTAGLIGIRFSDDNELLFLQLSAVYFFPHWKVKARAILGRTIVVGETNFDIFWEIGKPETLKFWKANSSPFKPLVDLKTNEILERKLDTLSIGKANRSLFKPPIDIEKGETLVQERKMREQALLGLSDKRCILCSLVIATPLVLVFATYLVLNSHSYKSEE